MSRCGLLVVALSAVVGPVHADTTPPPYRWKSVQMVGAGFVDGIVFHPTARNVRYARTDMGGAYRWDARARKWAPILDWVSYPDTNLMGVESIAVDPQDAGRVYLACGTYTSPTSPNGAILRSRDGGRTFARTNVPFKFGGNENGRGNGERMMVDPNDGRVLYLGTRQAGLWRSQDTGETWTKVDTFPRPATDVPRASAGIVAVVFDAATGKRGTPTPAIYAAASTANGSNLFRSLDAGQTWHPVDGQPTGLMPTHLVRSDDGILWVTYGSSPGPSRMTNGAVWKFDPGNGSWTDVTPDRPDAANARGFGYVSVSVQHKDPKTVIVSSFGRPGGEQIFRSRDGGASWIPIIGGKETYDYRKAPYVAATGIHWLFDIEIDPNNPDHALFTTGYGGHETFNLRDADKGKPVRWSVMSTGIEESVALDLVSPTKGAHLMTGIGDYGGFVHTNLDRPDPKGNFSNPHFGNTNGVAAAENRPEIMVRTGRASGRGTAANIGYSLDGGRTWQPTKSVPPGATLGRIAVSPDGKTWIWSQIRGAFRTEDQGETWTPCAGIPANVRVVADRVNSRRFYGLSLFDGKLYTSLDAGATFTEQTFTLTGGIPRRGERGSRGDDRGGQDQIYPTPGQEGKLWLAAFDGLHFSPDGGATFRRIPGIRELHAFGFGKGAPGRKSPTIYMVGVVQGQRGIFRSDDAARSWTRINDDAHQWGLVLLITGDPKRYGRVYVGTHGRGTFYGDPVLATSP